MAGELTGSRLVLGHFSDTSPRVAPSLRQPCSGAPAAHQPVGNGRAQIRCSIDPNSRRVIQTSVWRLLIPLAYKPRNR
jgi:hypothetical protein